MLGFAERIWCSNSHNKTHLLYLIYFTSFNSYTHLVDLHTDYIKVSIVRHADKEDEKNIKKVMISNTSKTMQQNCKTEGKITHCMFEVNPFLWRGRIMMA